MLYMGAGPRAVATLFDTTSAWTLVQTSQCTLWACLGAYDYSAGEGDTFNFVDEYKEFRFGSTTVTAQAATDTVCIAPGTASCTAGFKWMALADWAGGYGTNLASLNALFGLGSGGDGDTAPLLMHSLYADGVVSENKFSVALTEDRYESSQGLSHIDFGPPDPTAMTDEADLAWLDVLPGDAMWANRISGVRFGGLDADVDADFALTPKRAFTDTTSSCISGPAAEVDFITAALSDVLDVYDYDVAEAFSYAFDCDPNIDSFRSIYLLFGDSWFELRPEDYLYNGGRGRCGFCIFRSNNDYWTLGANFLRGWYAVHDYESSRFGFVPQAKSGREKATPVTRAPTRSIASYDGELRALRQVLAEWKYITLVVAGGVGFLCFAGALIALFCYDVR